MSASVISTDIDGVHQELLEYNDWTITARKSHILQSKCASPFICGKTNGGEKCHFCRYDTILMMPHMPDMTYARNSLNIKHKHGFAIEFNCIDALKLVKREHPSHLVAASEEWLKARNAKVMKTPFDWTFTTDYKGTLLTNESGQKISYEETDERIDIEKLKVKEEILFYDDIHLFEDEISDHGVAQCSAKIRVMKGSFFILLRYFLRIDNVMVRIIDSRFYYEVGSDHILSERTIKESTIQELDFPSAILTNPVELNDRLKAKHFICEKLTFPLINK